MPNAHFCIHRCSKRKSCSRDRNAGAGNAIPRSSRGSRQRRDRDLAPILKNVAKKSPRVHRIRLSYVAVKRGVRVLEGKCREEMLAVSRRWQEIRLGAVRCFCNYRAWIQQQVDGLELVDKPPRPEMYANLLQECCDAGALESGRRLHEQLRHRGIGNVPFVQNMLVQMYGKCGSLGEARAVFEEIGEDNRNLFSWNIMISAYVQNREFAMALDTYDSMNLTPSAVTFVSVLSACAALGCLEPATEVHTRARELKLHTNPIVGSALVTTLSRCGSLDSAKVAFAGMPFKDVVAWTSMITAFAQNGHGTEALQTFFGMVLEGVKPDGITAVSVLDACSVVKSIKQGSRIHDLVIRHTSLCYMACVGNALVNMYAKCGDLTMAWKVFQSMDKKDVVSWNTMLAAYARSGHFSKALLLYSDGLCKFRCIKPDAVTFITLLDACTNSGDLKSGIMIQKDAANLGLDAETTVCNALVTMYGTCGELKAAREIFDRMEGKRNIVSWNSMISLYVQQNLSSEALDLYRRMDLKPDAVTLAGALTACGMSSDLTQGKLIHDKVAECRLEGVVGVANSLIGMYAKCGSIADAQLVFGKISDKGSSTWNAMMFAFADSGETLEALKLFPLMDLEGAKPDEVTFLAILSSCTDAGLLDDAWGYFTCMVEDCKIEPGEKHYGCIIDLLGRVGKLNWITNVISNMPFEPGAVVWKMILSACQVHGDFHRAEYAAERAMELDPADSGPYVALCNIYRAAERWEDLDKVQKRMQVKCAVTGATAEVQGWCR